MNKNINNHTHTHTVHHHESDLGLLTIRKAGPPQGKPLNFRVKTWRLVEVRVSLELEGGVWHVVVMVIVRVCLELWEVFGMVMVRVRVSLPGMNVSQCNILIPDYEFVEMTAVAYLQSTFHL